MVTTDLAYKALGDQGALGQMSAHLAVLAGAMKSRASMAAEVSLPVCGTFEPRRRRQTTPVSARYPLGDDNWKSKRRGVRYSIVNWTPYIDYFHPQARMSGNLVHYELIDAVAELGELA